MGGGQDDNNSILFLLRLLHGFSRKNTAYRKFKTVIVFVILVENNIKKKKPLKFAANIALKIVYLRRKHLDAYKLSNFVLFKGLLRCFKG